MDAATLYMIVTMQDGQMRASHWPQAAIAQCEQRISRVRDTNVVWCRDILIHLGH
jgi:hypothetical protein